MAEQLEAGQAFERVRGAAIRFLKQEEVIEAGVLDMAATLDDVERALAMLSRGDIMNPPKNSMMLYDQRGSWRSMFNTMPVYIGGGIDRPGVKWAAESTRNARVGDLPLGVDVLVLSDAETALPVGIMDATLITAMRTAANAAVAVRYLANPSSRQFGLVGAGVIGRTTLMALAELDFEYEYIALCDLKRDKAEALAVEFGDRLPVRVVENAEEAARGAEVLITATTAKRPIIDHEWLGHCTLAVEVAADEFRGDTILAADLLSLDDWDQMIHFTGSVFAKLHEEGEIKRDDIVHLRDIVSGKVPGRLDADQRILHMSRGLACLDVMVGDRLYKEAVRLGLGQSVPLWDNPKWL